MKLPQIPYNRSIMRPEVQTEFHGLNHNIFAKDGELYSTINMTARHFPLLATRDKRVTIGNAISKPRGLAAQDDLVWISDKSLYIGGVLKATSELIADTEHQFAFMGNLVIIFPERLIYDATTQTLNYMGALTTYEHPVFTNGTIYGESAYANTMYLPNAVGLDAIFKPGDALTITGCETHSENNKMLIVREVGNKTLTFDENAFTLDPVWRWTPTNGILPGAITYFFTINGTSRQFDGPGESASIDYLEWDGTTLKVYYDNTADTIPVTEGSTGVELIFSQLDIVQYTEAGTVSIAREVPALDFICVNENRLWGCKGDIIYASKLGDPRNFNVFDGLDTDSWQSQTVDAGDFTACISYLGYPIFFKEHNIYKVHGDKPSNFQWTPSARFGVKAGCHKSLAVASETLFYVSPSGICAYNGGMPSVISEDLGVDKQWYYAVAGSDGLRYYVSMKERGDDPQHTPSHLYVYDTRYRTWHYEDGAGMQGFAYCHNALYGLIWGATDVAYLTYLCGEKPSTAVGSGNTEEASTGWEAEFADAYYYYKTTLSGSENKKGLLRLQIRCELDTAATMNIHVMYDSSGVWEQVYSLTATVKKSFNVPLILRRCDHFRLKFEGVTGTGSGARIYSITKVRYAGSNLQ